MITDSWQPLKLVGQSGSEQPPGRLEDFDDLRCVFTDRQMKSSNIGVRFGSSRNQIRPFQGRRTLH